MQIGFDAKRLYYNSSGLGEYARNLVLEIARREPEIGLYLYASTRKSFSAEVSQFLKHLARSNKNLAMRGPVSTWEKLFPAAWRRKGVLNQLIADGIELYHGLSNELPLGIGNTSIYSVVTIHDLIFMEHPEGYGRIDRKIYERKSRHACQVADRIIATSEATRDDIIRYFGVNPDKISVVYQNCRPEFYQGVEDSLLNAVKRTYNLNEGYVLAVGAGNARKNLEVILEALKTFVPAARPELVIISGKGGYVSRLKKKTVAEGLGKWVKFVHGVRNSEMPALYSMARAVVFPSRKEGFGIPAIEAMAAGRPVVLADTPVFREVAGPAGIFAPVDAPSEWGRVLQALLTRPDFSREKILEGKERTLWFKAQDPVAQVLDIYKTVVNE